MFCRFSKIQVKSSFIRLCDHRHFGFMYVFVLFLQFGAVLTSASTHIIKLSRVPGLRVHVIMIFKHVCESNWFIVCSNVSSLSFVYGCFLVADIMSIVIVL